MQSSLQKRHPQEKKYSEQAPQFRQQVSTDRQQPVVWADPNGPSPQAVPSPPLRLVSPAGHQWDYPLLIFVPGMDGTGQLLASQIDYLRSHFDIRCLVIPPDDLTPWSGLVTQARTLICREAKGRPIYLLGESFGACLAMQLVSHDPALFHRLILVNPASSFRRLPWLAWVAGVTYWVAPMLYRNATLTAIPFLAAVGRIEPPNRKALLASMRSVSQRSAAWRMSLLSKFDPQVLRLDRFRNPVLLIAGTADRLLPSLQEAEALGALFQQAHIYRLPDSGHTCLLEKDVNLTEILAANSFLPPASPTLEATGQRSLRVEG